MAAKNYIIEVG